MKKTHNKAIKRMIFKLHFCHSASLHFMAKVQLKNHRLSQRYRKGIELAHYKKSAFVFGIFAAIVILVAGLELSALTTFFWPAMIGLMGLGGKIEGIADYLYVAFLVLLNGLLYLLILNFVALIYRLIKR